MLSWIVLILSLVLFSMLGLWLFSAVFGRGEALPPMPPTADVRDANRLAVEEGRFDDIQLEVVHRGYRMDQVDALIAQLTGREYVPVSDDAPREIAAPLDAASQAAAPDAGGQKSVDFTAESELHEGEPTHGSNETAYR